MAAAGFRMSLKKISDRLSSQDIDEIKYLCEDDIPLSRLEKMRTGTDIFGELIRKGVLGEANVSKLKFILESIGKEHLLALCTDAGYGGSSATYTPPFQSESVPKAAPLGNTAGDTSEFEYRKALTVIAGELTPHNFSELQYLSAEYFSGVEPRTHKPLELFAAMEQHRILMPGNLSALQSLLGSIGRKDLAAKLVTVANHMQPPSSQHPHPPPSPQGMAPHSTAATTPPYHLHHHQQQQQQQHSYYQQQQQPPPPQPQPQPLPPYSTPTPPPAANPYHHHHPHDPYGGGSGGGVHVLHTGPVENVSGFQDHIPYGEPVSSVRSTSSSLGSTGPTTRPDAQYPPPHQHQQQQLQQQPQVQQQQQQQQQQYHSGGGGGGSNSQSPENSMDSQPTVHPQPEVGGGDRDALVIGGNRGSGEALVTTNLPDRRDDGVMSIERSFGGNHILSREYGRKEIEEELLRERQAQLEKEQQQKQAVTQDLLQQQAREKHLRRQIQQLRQEREQLARQLQEEASKTKSGSGDGVGSSVSEELRYPMRHRPHGLCLIVNNDEFYSTSDEPKLPRRRGSDVDQSNLSIVFNQLGYKVEVLSNVTAAQILQKVKSISCTNHAYYDSFVCCLLTHGKLDGVFGSDGQLVAVSDLANMLNAASCPTLKGKPKMFFVQACRGDDEDRGSTLETDDGPDTNRLGRSLPNASDFLFAYSTAPGTVSWRSVTYGSWYISKLCEVLDHHAKEGMDLLSMLTIVNDKVSQAYTKQGFKQCPAPVNMLRKQVIFT